MRNLRLLGLKLQSGEIRVVDVLPQSVERRPDTVPRLCQLRALRLRDGRPQSRIEYSLPRLDMRMRGGPCGGAGTVIPGDAIGSARDLGLILRLAAGSVGGSAPILRRRSDDCAARTRAPGLADTAAASV